FALSIFATAIISLVLSFIMVSNESFLSDKKTLQWVSGVVAQLCIVACAVGYSIKKQINLPTAVGAKNKIKLWHIPALILLAFAVLCFMLPVQTFVANLLTNAGLTSPDGVIIDTTGDLVLGLVIACLLPALCEETVYRGFLCNSFAKPGKKVDVCAVLVSSALFSIMHMSPWQTIHPFALGCVIAIVYLATRSIWAAVILHFTNNALVLLLGYLLKGSFEAFVLANWWWIMLVALAIIVPVIWLFVKKAHVTQDATDEVMALRAVDRNKSLSFFTAGTVFCLFMWVFVVIG
ncbi:MAG: CPBP family intramembrane metalloprotease, partial [Clostridia bacterium]|nr:CPBP family intramembrane metalloprotease [Clostridia bacterium]